MFDCVRLLGRVFGLFAWLCVCLLCVFGCLCMWLFACVFVACVYSVACLVVWVVVCLCG